MLINLPSNLKINRRGAKDAKSLKGAWDIIKNPALLCLPLRLYRDVLAVTFAICVSPISFSQTISEPLKIWPDGKMPGLAMVADAIQPGQESTAVTTPTLTVYPTPERTKAAPAVLICPGGGYHHLAFDKEGVEIAKWLNTLGITGIVLKYRVPGNRDGAYQDIQRAMRIARAHGNDWHIAPGHIGVIGFSAGGHLSARLSNNYEAPAYPAIDATDNLTCKPDFVILVYPAYLDSKGVVAPELPVTAKTPPTLIVHNEDDPGFLRGSKIYHHALVAAKVPNEFLLFQKGGHGYALRSKNDVAAWPVRTSEWLIKIGVL